VNETPQAAVQIDDDIALFPLNTVLFPGGRLPLRIFEQRYMDMAKACLRDDRPFGVCLILEGKEVGAPALPAEIGCLARIATWDMPQLGVLQVVAAGQQRFRIAERRVQEDGLQRARLHVLQAETDGPIPADCARCVALLERVIEQAPALFDDPPRLDSCAWVSARLAEALPLRNAAKQALLELDDGRARLERVNQLLGV
jgi:Lon protease-like protein